MDTNLARVAGTNADKRVGELALEVYGSEALAYESFAAANFRLSLTAGVAVGATEVQLNLISAPFPELPQARSCTRRASGWGKVVVERGCLEFARAPGACEVAGAFLTSH